MRKRKRCEDDEEDDENIVELCAGTHILFYAEVSTKTICLLRKILLGLEKKKQTSSEYTLHIHSNGGCAYGGLAGYDMLQASPLHINTVIEGSCASAATLLSLGGRTRYIMSNATYLIHQVSTAFMGTFEELEADLENSQHLMNTYVNIYQKHSNMSKVKLLKEMRSDREMSAKVAIERGFIDEVWPNPNQRKKIQI